jgi:hypothetical protein
MDAAYDAPEIREHCQSAGQVALIDPVQRAVPIPHRTQQDSLRGYDKCAACPEPRGETLPFHTAQEERSRLRSVSERVNAHLKGEFRRRTTRVRGAKK